MYNLPLPLCHITDVYNRVTFFFYLSNLSVTHYLNPSQHRPLLVCMNDFFHTSVKDIFLSVPRILLHCIITHLFLMLIHS